LLAAVLVVENAVAQLPDLTDGYLCTGRCEPGVSCVMIAQNGVELIITHQNGDQTHGRFLSNSQIQAGEPNDTGNGVLEGTISKDQTQVVWDNDTIWIRTELCPDPQEQSPQSE
jgi:hypothetical protein